MTFTHPITGITTSLNTHATSGVASCRLEKITTVSDGLHFTVVIEIMVCIMTE